MKKKSPNRKAAKPRSKGKPTGRGKNLAPRKDVKGGTLDAFFNFGSANAGRSFREYGSGLGRS